MGPVGAPGPGRKGLEFREEAACIRTEAGWLCCGLVSPQLRTRQGKRRPARPLARAFCVLLPWVLEMSWKLAE